MAKNNSALLEKLKGRFGEAIQIGMPVEPIEVISSGSLGLDIALGVGGWVKGRICCLGGKFSAGKTTLALKAVKSMQEKGLKVAFIDTEYALNLEWAEKIGVDTSEDMFTLIRADDLETAGDACVEIADSGLYGGIIFDSIAGSSYKVQVDNDLGKANIGVRAKIMSSFMPKLNGPVYKNGVYMMFTNQIRDSLDVFNPLPVLPGGHAAPHHYSQLVFLSLKTPLKERNEKLQVLEIEAKVWKSKLSAPYRTHNLFMSVNGEIDRIKEISAILTNEAYFKKLGIIKGGAWYTLPEDFVPVGMDSKIQGQAKIEESLASDMDVLDHVEATVRKKLIRENVIA